MMNQLSGHTTPFAVLGHPIGHTLSPVMHNASIEALGMDAIYLAFDVHPDRVMDVLPAMRDMGFGGVNLTIPHKEIAFEGLDDLADSARLLGAANTIQFVDGKIVGHNTDGYGFVRAVEESFGMSMSRRSLFVLGCGGAGRAVALTAATHGAGKIILSDVDQARCEKAADEIRKEVTNISVEIVTSRDAQPEACRSVDIVVQATPVGMKQDDTPLLSPECFREGQCAFDLIYMYPETVFMKEAMAGGARAANGLGMLLHQGAKAFEIWTNREPRVDVMRKSLEDAVYGVS